MLPRNAIILQNVIMSSLYHLSSGRSRKLKTVKKIGKCKTFSSKSGRDHLREMVGVGAESVRVLTTYKNRCPERVTSSTESESESKRFLPIPITTPLLMIQ